MLRRVGRFRAEEIEENGTVLGPLEMDEKALCQLGAKNFFKITSARWIGENIFCRICRCGASHSGIDLGRYPLIACGVKPHAQGILIMKN